MRGSRNFGNIIFPGLFFKIFPIFDHLWWFWLLGFGIGVLVWVFGLGVFSCWGLGSLHKHKRITLGKKW